MRASTEGTMRAISLCLAVVSVLLAPSISAIEPPFQRVHLAGAVSIEYPSHWFVIDADSRNNLVLSGHSALELAGVGVTSNKVRVFAANSTPSPTGAMIGLSLSWPPEYSQADLAVATPEELDYLASDCWEMMKSAEPVSGLSVLEVQGVDVEHIGGDLALVFRYRRASQIAQSPWQVTHYKIPLNDRIVELTLSYRESDQCVWRPILEKVKRSLTY